MRRFLLVLLYNIFSFIELLLLLRVSLKILDANPKAFAVERLYSATDFLLLPIQGIFANITLASGGIIDVVGLTGMVLFLIVFAVVLKALSLVFKTRDFA